MEGVLTPHPTLFQKLVPEIRAKMGENWSLRSGAPDLTLLSCNYAI